MKTTTVWGIVAALAAILWLPNLFTLGMFTDGVVHALVAKNLAQGKGTLFHLQENYYANAEYVGHPPLAFALLAAFYKITGTAFFAERIYSLLCALVQLWLIKKLFETVIDNPEQKHLSTWACLFWLFSPLVGWGYSNNLLENTLSLFTTAAVWAMVACLKKNRNYLVYAFLSATLCLLAGFTKGPVALFVCITPIIFAGAFPVFSFKQAVKFAGIFLAVLAGLFFVLWNSADVQQWHNAYMREQLLPAVSRGNIGARFKIMGYLCIALSTIAAAWLALYFLGRESSVQSKADKRTAIRFLLLGLAASLPMIISSKQSNFYLLPSIPLFAIAAALGSADYIPALMKWFEQPKIASTIKYACMVTIVACIAVSVMRFASPHRDIEMLQDIQQVAIITKDEPCINADWEVIGQYDLRAYLYRLYDKTTYPYGEKCHTRWELYKNNPLDTARGEMVYDGKYVDLYRKPDWYDFKF